MRKAMKQIDADATGEAPITESANNQSSCILPHLPAANCFCPALVSKKDLCEVTVDETYQLGVELKDKNEIYLFDFVDSVEVSYSANLKNTTTEVLENHPPYFHGHLFDDNLTELASDVLRRLAARLNTWMDALDSKAKDEFVSRHMIAYEELTVIRRQIFTLIKLFVPNPSLSCGFDCTTADLDRLLDRLIVELGGSDCVKQNSPPKFPLVTLCVEPEHCVDLLRKRVLVFLKIILPNLTLPEYFDLTRDLPDLINAIYSYNAQAF